jgi:hypothetical protein
MKKNTDHHAMRRPAMHVPKEGSHEDDELEILHILICLRGVRPVIAHERYARGYQDDEEKERDEAQIETVLELQVFFFDLGRMNVQPHIEKDQFGLSLVGGQRIPPYD